MSESNMSKQTNDSDESITINPMWGFTENETSDQIEQEIDPIIDPMFIQKFRNRNPYKGVRNFDSMDRSPIDLGKFTETINDQISKYDALISAEESAIQLNEAEIARLESDTLRRMASINELRIKKNRYVEFND